MEVLKLHTPLTTLEDAVAMAKNWYSNYKGEPIPTMLSYTKTEVMVVALPQIGDREHGGRRHSMEFAKMFNTLFDVKIYCIITESYVLKSKTEEEERKWAGRIQHHPDAVEKLTVMVCSKEKNFLVYFDITKDRKLENEERFENVGGEFTELGALDIPKDQRDFLRAKFMQDFKMSPSPNARDKDNIH